MYFNNRQLGPDVLNVRENITSQEPMMEKGRKRSYVMKSIDDWHSINRKIPRTRQGAEQRHGTVRDQLQNSAILPADESLGTDQNETRLGL